MRNALAIARKELSIYFTTPWAYVVFTAMLGISSFFFVSLLANFKRGAGAGPGLRLGTRLPPGVRAVQEPDRRRRRAALGRHWRSSPSSSRPSSPCGSSPRRSATGRSSS